MSKVYVYANFVHVFHIASYINTIITPYSRTETLSGRYYHNIGFNTTNSTCMHIDATHYTFFNESMFPLFQSNGYTTAMFGKLTNDVSPWCSNAESGLPPKLTGFDRIYAMCQQSNYYGPYWFDKHINNSYSILNYTNRLNDKSIGFNYHQTPLIGNKTIDFLHSISNSSSPFLIWIGPHAPHEPAVPTSWYGNEFNNISTPHTPNYNLSSPNKHAMVADSPPLNNTAEYLLDNLYRDRLRSLLSVNDIIKGLWDEIFDKYEGLLDNTYIIYTSDHGFHLGQWGIACYKAQMYETDIHVPFYMRGPNLIGITRNKKGNDDDDNDDGLELKLEYDHHDGNTPAATLDNLIGNVDILPTLLDLANIDKPENIDGKSFAQFIVTDKNRHYYGKNIRKNEKHKSKLTKISKNWGNKNVETAKAVKDRYNYNSGNRSNNNWRDMFLVQFKADASAHCFGMCNIWFANESDVLNPCYPGRIDNPPCGPHGMQLPWWYVNDPVSNNYRALRIMNDTFNIVYTEFVNFSWTIEDLENPNFYEYYNLTNDPYQMNNSFNTLTQNEINYYHSIIMDLGQCSGSQCP